MKPFAASPRLADLLAGRDNNLNLIRFVAASAVLVSHAFPITLGTGAEEPLEELTGMSLGGHAVAIFFVLSGLLIARSFDRGSDRIRFVMARILRLFPALLAVLVLTVLFGATVTNLGMPQYFTAPGTLTYIPSNLSLAFLQYPLPGVFTDNPNGPAINGSLWTLFYEVVCYGAVFLLGVLGVLRKPRIFTLVFLAIAAAFVGSVTWHPQGGLAYRLDLLAQLGFPFALGTLAYLWRDKLVLDWRIAIGLWAFPFLAYTSVLLPLTIIVATAYSLAWFGFVLKGPLLNFNRLGDYSYGIYIFAYPVQQTMVHLNPGMGPYENMLASMPITLLFAIASWHLIEERALTRVKPAAQSVRRMVPGVPTDLPGQRAAVAASAETGEQSPKQHERGNVAQGSGKSDSRGGRDHSELR